MDATLYLLRLCIQAVLVVLMHRNSWPLTQLSLNNLFLFLLRYSDRQNTSRRYISFTIPTSLSVLRYNT